MKMENLRLLAAPCWVPAWRELWSASCIALRCSAGAGRGRPQGAGHGESHCHSRRRHPSLKTKDPSLLSNVLWNGLSIWPLGRIQLNGSRMTSFLVNWDTVHIIWEDPQGACVLCGHWTAPFGYWNPVRYRKLDRVSLTTGFFFMGMYGTKSESALARWWAKHHHLSSDSRSRLTLLESYSIAIATENKRGHGRVEFAAVTKVVQLKRANYLKEGA